jgi:hypothetical protein
MRNAITSVLAALVASLVLTGCQDGLLELADSGPPDAGQPPLCLFFSLDVDDTDVNLGVLTNLVVGELRSRYGDEFVGPDLIEQAAGEVLERFPAKARRKLAPRIPEVIAALDVADDVDAEAP